ncbi:MAG TPA: acyl-CoA dehydrogenase family protein, partial [Vicinamibacteria bacterium]|nr:acyl-CoA dehydrogenase family protein [Vicinamibacteria bacterium]
MSSAGILTSLAEEEEIFRGSVREFARNEIQPHVSRMDREMKLDSALVQKLFELGLMGIEIPEKHGGAGASFFMSVLAVEELSRVDPSVGVMVDVQNTLVNNALLRWGTEEQKARFLRPIARHQEIWCQLFSEPGAGSDLAGLATRAVRDGASWIVNGQKVWTSLGDRASFGILLART